MNTLTTMTSRDLLYTTIVVKTFSFIPSFLPGPLILIHSRAGFERVKKKEAKLQKISLSKSKFFIFFLSLIKNLYFVPLKK